MTLSKKIFLSVISVIAVSAVLLISLTKFILLDSYSELEEQSMVKNLMRISEAIEKEKNELNSICLEYSWWDDTYDYVETHNPNYVTSNFSDLITMSKFKIDFLFILNNDGEILLCKGYDNVEQREAAVSDSLIAQIISEQQLIKHDYTNSSVNGLINTKHGPALLVSNPIITSMGEGPVAGTFVMGRYLNEHEALRISKTTQLPIRIYSYNASGITADLTKASTELSDSKPFYTAALSSHTYAGYLMLNDVFDTPCLIVKTDMSRAIYDSGKTSVMYFIVVLVILGAVVCITIMLMLKKILLNRLAHLSTAALSIAESGDLSIRMKDISKDELSKLVLSFNNMLSALEKAQYSIRENEVKFRSLFDNMREGFTYNEIVLNSFGEPIDFIIHEANDAFVSLYKLTLSKNEIIGKRVSELSPEIRNCHLELLMIFKELSIKGEGRKIEEIYSPYLNKWFSISAYSIKNGYFAAIYNDITEIKHAEMTMQHLAYHDSLTDLPNRKLLYSMLESTIHSCKLYNEHFAILFLDLNNFKRVNDSLGHDTGDKLLIQVSHTLTGLLEADDIAARLGGDEFIIVKKHISSRKDAEALAGRIIEAVRFELNHQGEVLIVDASIGISIFPEDATDIQGLLHKADMAMYGAKGSNDAKS